MWRATVRVGYDTDRDIEMTMDTLEINFREIKHLKVKFTFILSMPTHSSSMVQKQLRSQNYKPPIFNTSTSEEFFQT